MAAVNLGANLTGLARAMVTQGLLAPGDGENLQNQAKASGESFIAHLLRTRRFRADQIAGFAATTFGHPFINLEAVDSNIFPRTAIDPKLQIKHRVLPMFQRGNKLFVAISDPSNVQALDDVKFQTGLVIEAIVVEDDKLGRLLDAAPPETEDDILQAIDFRVSTLPTLYGEKIVMRILDAKTAQAGIENLGYEPDQLKLLIEAVKRPYGMVLVTGPTGSGKTVSLYACLNLLNKPDVNISTAEDPVEIQLAGINQVNINDKTGLNFAAALISFLRQDPDIIMVGEIRDLETGEIAIKAAQTGHMVLSTLHTNDAPSTLTRLMNMGVPTYNIAASVHLITAQRLGRRLCNHCKKPLDIPPEALLNAGFNEADLDGSWQAYGPVGCDMCKGTGYKGRVGIYQVMPISEDINRIILKNGSALDIADQARREGVLNLREAGLLKVKQGITSLEEVLTVTNE
jgi:type II secretory ATPase GspE/PulE/Tfp pilus assembly ATPase PilB-like protein